MWLHMWQCLSWSTRWEHHTKRSWTMNTFSFHLATGLPLHSHTCAVTRDALPLSHVQRAWPSHAHACTLIAFAACTLGGKHHRRARSNGILSAWQASNKFWGGGRKMAFNNREAGGVLKRTVHVTAPPSLGTCHTSFHSFHLLLWFSFGLARGSASACSPQTFVSSLHSSSSSRSYACPPSILYFPVPTTATAAHFRQAQSLFTWLTEKTVQKSWMLCKRFFSFFCEMKKINWLCKSQDCHALNWLWMTALWAIFNGPLFKLHTYIFWF